MITEAILNIFQTVVQALLFLLPNIPQISNDLLNGITAFTDTVVDVIGVISYLYTPAMLVFVITLFIAVLWFDNIYGFVLWLYHKVRG